MNHLHSYWEVDFSANINPCPKHINLYVMVGSKGVKGEISCIRSLLISRGHECRKNLSHRLLFLNAPATQVRDDFFPNSAILVQLYLFNFHIRGKSEEGRSPKVRSSCTGKSSDKLESHGEGSMRTM